MNDSFVCSFARLPPRPFHKILTIGTSSGPSTDDAHMPISSSDARRTDSSTSKIQGSSPAASPTRARGANMNHDLSIHSLQAHTAPTNASGWSKSNLRPDERGPWTRGRDGRRGVGAEVRSVSFFCRSCFWKPSGVIRSFHYLLHVCCCRV